MSYDLPDHAVRDSSPTAAQTATRHSKSNRERVARSRTRPVPASTKSRHSDHRRHRTSEVPSSHWRLQGHLRRRCAGGQDRRGVYQGPQISLGGIVSRQEVKAAESCSSCGRGRLRPRDSREERLGIDMRNWPSPACDTCEESHLDGESMARLEERAKELGIWGLSELRFRKLTARFRAEAGRRGVAGRQLLRAVEDIREERA